MVSVLLDIFKHEGISGWHRGFPATMINSFSMQYAYFFYSFLRTYVIYYRRAVSRRSNWRPLPNFHQPRLRHCNSTTSRLLITRSKASESYLPETDSDGKGDDNSFFAVAQEIIRKDGVTGLWFGIKSGMVLTINPANTYGTYERLKSILSFAPGATAGASDKLTSGLTFLLGAFSKTLATIVTYLYIMAKAHPGTLV